MKKSAIIISWLNHILDLEYTVMNLFERHAEEGPAADPEVSERMNGFMAKSKEHAIAVGDCITRFGGKVGASKGLPGVIKGALLDVAETAPEDSEVQKALDEWTAEQALIIRLETVVTALRSLDENEAAMTLEPVLEDKRATATWLEEYASGAVKNFIETEN